jgi:hypothetical protein
LQGAQPVAGLAGLEQRPLVPNQEVSGIRPRTSKESPSGQNITYGVSVSHKLATEASGNFDADSYAQIIERVEELGYDFIVAADHVFAGRYLQAGATGCSMSAPGETVEECRDNLARFAEEVIPQL